MPLLTSKDAVRALLQTDPAWAVYALGDLAPGFFEHCSWHVPEACGRAIALLYRGFDTPILWAMGGSEDLAPIMDQLTASASLILQIRPDLVPQIEARYQSLTLKPMWRMSLNPARFTVPGAPRTARLAPRDLDALNRLYDDGRACGEGPDFFHASMLEQGLFHGAWEDGELTAVAGTHILSSAERAAAIGNVYTRRDRRGRGLASKLTASLTLELLDSGITTIALSVAQKNAPAIAVYRRLGFSTHCDFYEGFATGRIG